ncbi:LPXTG cell wall anchor domain-containing protein [Methanoregula sp.]|uniref:LPXTG cell wall anchor domain-containing protein n=1 Tax=Methanoregula sp. TaxID=2052170 RepID=UPI00356429EB
MFAIKKPQQWLARQNTPARRESKLLHTKSMESTRVTIPRLGFLIMLVAALGLLVLPVSAFETPESIVAASKVYVSNVVYDPGSFFTGDSGTVTVFVTNANTNQSAVVNHVSFGDQDIRLTSRPYDSSTNIGPLQTQKFVFSVETGAKEGTYYPTFTLTFRDADSLYYRATVKVDNTPLVLTILDKPDAYAVGQEKTVYMQVANPRDNTVRNAILDVTGPGITATPEKMYIGDIAAGAKIPINFTIAPDYPTTATISLTYDNGDNPHRVAMNLSIPFGLDKKQASPLMSNVQVKLTNGVYHVTGDVTNAGLTNANGVTVTAMSPAVPLDPYRAYVIGALKPDDFGSFEVTFSAKNTATVPLQMSYKDSDGNIITSQQDISISGITSDDTATQQGNPLLPVIGILIVIGIGAGYIYHKRRKNQ